MLLVEDEPVDREIRQMLLEEVGLAVELAEDGRQALELAQQDRCALILMDMQMPVMNGIEATQAIRRSSVRPCWSGRRSAAADGRLDGGTRHGRGGGLCCRFGSS